MALVCFSRQMSSLRKMAGSKLETLAWPQHQAVTEMSAGKIFMLLVSSLVITSSSVYAFIGREGYRHGLQLASTLYMFRPTEVLF